MLTSIRLRRQLGTSLIELMIGSTVGLLVLSAVSALYANTVQINGKGLALVRLNQELQATLYLITLDLRRSGYWAGRPGLDPMGDNPFFLPENALRVGQHPQEERDSCILFSYDVNGDKRVGLGSSVANRLHYSDENQERLGFRLRDRAVQTRTGGRIFDCTAGYWQAVTEPDVEITELRFVLHEDCRNLLDATEPCASDGPTEYLREVDVHLSGQLARDPQIKSAITESVQVRNHHIIASKRQTVLP
jgi:type II secretory pathway component PulJ